jgi:hypothetical protein
VGEKMQSFAVTALTTIQDDTLRNEFILERLNASKDRWDGIRKARK